MMGSVELTSFGREAACLDFHKSAREDPMQLCCRLSRPEILKLLLEQCESHAIPAANFDASMQLAASAGAIECINLLVAAGANVNARDSMRSWTPLFFAGMRHPFPLLALLFLSTPLFHRSRPDLPLL
jgi:ankyrin repeat protein